MKILITEDDATAAQQLLTLLQEKGHPYEVLPDQPVTYQKTMLVTVKDKLVPVPVENIVCIYSSDRRTQLFLDDGRVFSYNKTLDAIVSHLDPQHFFRANKQYVVSRHGVQEIVIWFDNRLLLRLPVEIPEPLFVSKNRASEFKEWMTDPPPVPPVTSLGGR